MTAAVTPAGLIVPAATLAAVPDAVLYAQREPPAEWVARLREISPVSEVVSWLDLKWSVHSQRWRLYDCVPIQFVTDEELVKDLMGPDPDSPEGQREMVTVSRYQQEMFRTHKVHARDFWCIQGTKGGNPVVYSESTKELCRAYRLPTEPPAPGSQCYAPFDERVVVQLLRYNKLMQCKNDLGQFKRTYGSVENWKQEKRNQLREARTLFVQMLNDQLLDGDDDLKSAVRKGELADAPRDDREFVQENEEMDARYIETGHF
ncbi:MAG TPA: hypothetical protein VMZ71_13005 [Gemmataceae bacterium]|nr:hypothetical protein [Gemmataceae bacterium]